MKEIKVARLVEGAILPTRKHPADAGIDIYIYYDFKVPGFLTTTINTGISVEIPEGFVGILKPKGKNEHLIGSGVVDAGYQGEIIVRVFNTHPYPINFKAGDAICQMVIYPTVTPKVVEVSKEEIHEVKSLRGTTGGIHGISQLNFLETSPDLHEWSEPE